MEKKRTLITEDSFLAAPAKVFGCKITSFLNDSTGKVNFKIEGDIESVVNQIYRDTPVGVKTLLSAIKELRQNIFLLKAANGQQKG